MIHRWNGYKPWPFATIFIQEKKSLLSHKDPLGIWTWERCCMERQKTEWEREREQKDKNSDWAKYQRTFLHHRHIDVLRLVPTSYNLNAGFRCTDKLSGSCACMETWVILRRVSVRIKSDACAFSTIHATRLKRETQMEIEWEQQMITELFLTHSPGVFLLITYVRCEMNIVVCRELCYRGNGKPWHMYYQPTYYFWCVERRQRNCVQCGKFGGEKNNTKSVSYRQALTKYWFTSTVHS